MLRSLIAVIAGVVLGVVVVKGVEMVGMAVFPPPDLGIDFSNPETLKDREAMGRFIQAVPPGGKIAVVLGWFLGALGGGVTALLIGRKWSPLGWIVAGAIFLLSVTNFFAFPHPLWMVAGAVFSALLGGFGATALTGSKFAPPRAPD